MEIYSKLQLNLKKSYKFRFGDRSHGEKSFVLGTHLTAKNVYTSANNNFYCTEKATKESRERQAPLNYAERNKDHRTRTNANSLVNLIIQG